jgi:hypothetical protein
MNDICTPLRSSLSQENLDAIMRVCKEGPDLMSDDTLEKALNMFKDKKKRKLLL